HGLMQNSETTLLDSVEAENLSLLEFYARCVLPLMCKQAEPRRLLEVGGGPTIYQLISLAPTVTEIWFTDYLEANIQMVRQWTCRASLAWQSSITAAMTLECGQSPTQQILAEREAVIKQNLTRLLRFDVVLDVSAQGLIADASFDVVCSIFCLESITKEEH